VPDPALIDRWYDVYDRKVREQTSLAPEGHRFAVPEHVAVWNRSGVPSQPSDRLDLAALKAAAQKGSTEFSGSGQYISMPLDGRLDLIMPKPHAKQVKFADTTPSASTAPGSPVQPTASGPDIVVPTPRPYEQATWDAAHFPPPQHGQPEMMVSMDTRYRPAWERPTAEQASYHSQRSTQSQYPTLPSNVRHDEWYREYTHTAPDRNSVRAVFPWERQGQRQADRVFPRGDTPPPQHGTPRLSLQEATPTTSPEPHHSETRSTPQPPQPRSMAEAMASYKNAWDADPRIGRYVNRMTGGAPSRNRHTSGDFGRVEPILQSVPGTPSHAPQAWPHHSGKSDASEDGDDEDDGDDEPDIGSSPPSVGRSEMNELTPRPFTLPDAPAYYKSNAKYRDRTSQTDKPEQSDAKVQAYPSGVSPVVSTQRLPSASTGTSMSRPNASSSGSGSYTRKGKGSLGRSQPSSSSDTPKPQSSLVTPASSQSPPKPFPPYQARYQSPPHATSPLHDHDPSTTDHNPNKPVSASRVFHPSTDVDMRKRDSQQVLSRFMQAGSFAKPGGSGSAGSGEGH
jgi:glycogenin glucosyltransferase